MKMMNGNIRDLILPEFAFVEGWGDHDILNGRNVMLHTRTASVIEMLPEENALALRADVLTHKFDYINAYGIVEHFIAVLHYCATLDKELDGEMIREKVLSPAASWFCEYMEWEDKNILNEEI